MALTVTLTSSQPSLLAMTVLVVNGAAASPAGQWAADTSNLNTSLTPDGSGSLVVGAGHFHATVPGPSYLSPVDAGTQLLNDSQQAGGYQGAVTFRGAAADTVAGTPVTVGAANSGLQDDRECAILELLAAAGGITLDSSAPPPLPATAPQNGALGTGGLVTSKTSASFTPPPSATLVVLGVNTYGSGSVLSVTDSAGTYDWSHPATVTSTGLAWVFVGLPPAPPPSGTGTASIALSATATGSKRASGTGTAHVALAGPGSGHKAAHGSGAVTIHLAGSPAGRKQAHGSGLASLALSAGGASYPGSPQIVAGDRTLLVAVTQIGLEDQAERFGSISPGTPFWVRSRRAAQIVSSGRAAYAPASTPLPPAEPPWTVRGQPGFARGTTNASR